MLAGIGTGVVASCLDILSAWLTDLRGGVCRDTWWMSKAVCCTGLDRESLHHRLVRGVCAYDGGSFAAGEACAAWRPWADFAGDPTHLVARALTQYSLYITLAVRCPLFVPPSLCSPLTTPPHAGRLRRHLVLLRPSLRPLRVPHWDPRDQDRLGRLHHRRLPQRMDTPDQVARPAARGRVGPVSREGGTAGACGVLHWELGDATVRGAEEERR